MSLNTVSFRMIKNVYLFILIIILPTGIITFHNRIDQQNVRINQQASKIEELASKLRDLETRIENQRPLTPPMVSCYMKRTISDYNSRHNNLGCIVQLGNWQAIPWKCVQELEMKIIRRFPKISQSRRRLLLGPSPGELSDSLRFKL